MAGKLYSPYSSHRRTSKALTLVWVGAFATILFLVWYVSTRRPDTAKRYAEAFAKPPKNPAKSE